MKLLVFLLSLIFAIFLTTCTSNLSGNKSLTQKVKQTNSSILASEKSPTVPKISKELLQFNRTEIKRQKIQKKRRKHKQRLNLKTRDKKLGKKKTQLNLETPNVTNYSSKIQKLIDESYNLSLTINSKKKSRCSVKNGGCSQICRARGRKKCACLEGYRLAKNRKKCIDVNECQLRNGGCKDICRNTLGAYFCDCSSGFRLSDDRKYCEDVNECHLRNGHGPCQGKCRNTFGSYSCDCSNLDGTRLARNGHSCNYINHCLESNAGCSHLCINTRSGGFCLCPKGLELMTDFKTCQDINECENPAFSALCSRNCVNTIGSYYCEEDFQNDVLTPGSRIPSCRPLDVPRVGFITCLRNNSEFYETKNGRKIIKNSPGTKCRLECPVGFKLFGEGRFLCDASGNWITKKSFCLKSQKPKLHCPPNQVLDAKNGTAEVEFRAPETSIAWRNLKAYPKWAKNLKGILGVGHHRVQFVATDPASKLSSSCSFSVIVKK